MKHPTHKQWMDFLYGELPPAENKLLEQHLSACAECQQQHALWRAGMTALDDWKIEAPVQHSFVRWQPAFKWAAAAVLLFTTAYAAGRLSQPEIDLHALELALGQPMQQAIRRDLEAQIQQQVQLATETTLTTAREELRSELNARFAEISEKTIAASSAAAHQQIEQLRIALAAVREEDLTALATSLESLETQRLNEYRGLREDLEKVALFTDQSLKHTQRRLVQLAGLTQPALQD